MSHPKKPSQPALRRELFLMVVGLRRHASKLKFKRKKVRRRLLKTYRAFKASILAIEEEQNRRKRMEFTPEMSAHDFRVKAHHLDEDRGRKKRLTKQRALAIATAASKAMR